MISDQLINVNWYSNIVNIRPLGKMKCQVSDFYYYGIYFNDNNNLTNTQINYLTNSKRRKKLWQREARRAETL